MIFTVMIAINSLNTKWYELMALIHNKFNKLSMYNEERPKFYQSFVFTHFIFVNGIFVVSLFVLYRILEEYLIPHLFWFNLVAYVALLYILCVYTNITLNILFKIRNNFCRMMKRKYNSSMEPYQFRAIQCEHRENMESCDLFNNLFGNILLVYSILGFIHFLRVITSIIEMTDEEKVPSMSFYCAIFIHLISLVKIRNLRKLRFKLIYFSVISYRLHSPVI